MIIKSKYCAICFILLAAVVFDCDRDRDDKSDCVGTICTQEFRYISILIKHSTDSSTVLLTHYKVLRVSDNKDITTANKDFMVNFGYYPLVSDADVSILRNLNVEIEFQGYIENALVIQKRFIVTADCCHVSLESGDQVFYI